MPYPTNGGPQAWRAEDVPFAPPYASITGGIFEFGFSDAIQHIWAVFCHEMLHGSEGIHRVAP